MVVPVVHPGPGPPSPSLSRPRTSSRGGGSPEALKGRRGRPAALLFTDRVIPVAHGTTFEAIRDVSPLLAAKSGLTIGDGLSMQEAAELIAAAAAA